MLDLAGRIKRRECEIDKICETAVTSGLRAITLAFEQGDDLVSAKGLCAHGEWQSWLANNFSKSQKTACYYMRLAAIPKMTRTSVMANAHSVNEAFRLLGILAPEPAKLIEDKHSISISPIIQHLSWVAEWTGKSLNEIKEWEQPRRDEMKLKLKPIVEIYESL